MGVARQEEPTKLQRRILGFFRRTRGLQSMSEVYTLAQAAYPHLSHEIAAERLYVALAEEERQHAATEGSQVDDETVDAVHSLINLQFAPSH